jgi:hypothetical protein
MKDKFCIDNIKANRGNNEIGKIGKLLTSL